MLVRMLKDRKYISFEENARQEGSINRTRKANYI